MFDWVREWRQFKAFSRLDPAFRDIVFYSEGSGDWPHIGPVIEELVRHRKRKVSLLTSDPGDPGLKLTDQNYRSFLIGSGAVRTIAFKTIECRHFAMTLVDLDQLQLKRSMNPVHYVYLFHSINSTHTVYREKAFDAYDTVLCVGPHHIDEIRKTEAAYELGPKELIPHGSVKIDTVISEVQRMHPGESDRREKTVLLAPSWGTCSFIESEVGPRLIDLLLKAGYRVVLRLHPMTSRRLGQMVKELHDRFSSNPAFVLEKDMNALASWANSDVMVSDWSGAAIEYAFATMKPVVYLNMPQKINNAEWNKVDAAAFEDFIRFEIGTVIEPDDIASVPSAIDLALCSAEQPRARILAAREKWVFNVGRSAAVAADYFASL